MSIAPVENAAKAPSSLSGASRTGEVEEVLSSYTGEMAVIPMLQHVQHELGYLPDEAMTRIAALARVPEATVFGVATFYAQFKFAPTGRNVVRVCRGTGCYVKGAPRILDEVERLLGIKDGETTPDLEYTLETVACFGSCALAPVVEVNGKVHGSMTPQKVKTLLAGVDEGVE